MVSHRLLQPHVSWASGYEFEDVICEVDDVNLIAVEPLLRTRVPWQDKVLSKLERQLGIKVTRTDGRKTTTVAGKYDLLFVRLAGPQNVEILNAVEGWQDSCRIKVCWIEEFWIEMLRYPKLLTPLLQFDHIFVGHAPTPVQLAQLVTRPCSFLAPAVDALRYCPYPNPPQRSIDFYSMGRRSPVTHRSLLARSANRSDFHYMYDSARWTSYVEDHIQHRELSANLIKRSRYFLTDRAKADYPDETKGGQVFGPRFFEGAAAGAVLIGDAPDCNAFRDHFDWPDAVVQLAYGSEGVGDLIEKLDSEHDRIERARRANISNALERHDWVYRWQQVLSTVGMSSLPMIDQRKAALQGRARDVFSAQQRRRLFSVAPGSHAGQS